MACLDTTVFIDLLGRSGKTQKSRAQAAVDAHTDPLHPHVTTRFNWAEMLSGVEGSRDPIAERQKVDAIMEQIPLLEFDEPSTLQFAKIDNLLHRIGHPKGDMDMLIAAVALANGESLLTRNAKDFADVPGLVVITY